MPRIGGEGGGQINRYKGPPRLGDDPFSDDDEVIDPIKKSFGERVKAFFAPVSDWLTNAISSARDWVNSIWTRLNPSSSPLMHIRQKDSLPQEPNLAKQSQQDRPRDPPTIIYNFSGDSSVAYESVSTLASSPASTPAQLQESPAQGMLGAIPMHSSAAVQEPKIDPPGKAIFMGYIDAMKKGGDIDSFVSDPDCLEFAKKICADALALAHSGAIQDESDQFFVTAAKELVNSHADRKTRDREREERASRDAEKLRMVEALASKVPGQQDFEDFVEKYVSHRHLDQKFVIFDGSKYLSDDCVTYASQFRDESASDQGKAAHHLLMWRANPAGAMAHAKQAQGFFLPPPPAQQSDLANAAQPAMQWEAAAQSMANIDDDERSKLTRILGFQLDDLNQACKGLAAISDSDKKGIQALLPENSLIKHVGLVPDATPNVIDDLQQARRLLVKTEQPGIAQQLSALNPRWRPILDAASRIKLLIDEQLQVLLPVRSTATANAVKLVDLKDLSDAELRAATEAFDKYQTDFDKAIKKGRQFHFLNNSIFLAPGCVAVANDVIKTLGWMNPEDMLDADRDRLLAASVLVNTASQRAKRRS